MKKKAVPVSVQVEIDGDLVRARLSFSETWSEWLPQDQWRELAKIGPSDAIVQAVKNALDDKDLKDESDEG
jgi:hypothetical protein